MSDKYPPLLSQRRCTIYVSEFRELLHCTIDPFGQVTLDVVGIEKCWMNRFH